MIVTITPQIAEKMLATSVGNRRLREWYVGQLAVSMKRGEWRVTSQGIGFDKNGHLRDAHHRLNAVARSGESIKSVCVFGLDTNAYEVTDIGMKRSVEDLAGWHKEVSHAVNFVSREYYGRSVTMGQIREIHDTGFGAAVEALIKYCGTARRIFSSALLKTAAALRIMDGEDASFVMGQYRALLLGDYDNMSKASQSFARTAAGRNGRMTHGELLTRALKSFTQKNAESTQILVRDASVAAAREYLREVIDAALKSAKGAA
jgi:hypothetical protein